MEKFIYRGALVGIALGILVNIIWPPVLTTELQFRLMVNQQLANSPDYYSPKLGSILATGTLPSLVLGIVGGVFGCLIFVVHEKYSRGSKT